MAPREVAGLQALAKAHGGTLTVNPDTGLAEAGFLSSILPMVAGAALTATGVGAPMAAMMVGGGMTLATGSLQKGLMAGLGAYGGAGLAGGLMGAGAAGAAGAGAGAGLGATETAMASLGTGPSGALLDPSLVAPVESSFALGAAPKGALTAGAMGTTAAAPSAFSPVTTGQLASGTSLVPTATSMPVLRAPIDPTFSSRLSQMGQGFTNLGEESGRAAFMDKIGGGSGLLKYGLAGFAPVLSDMMTPEAKEAQQRPVEATPRYAYDPGRIADPYSQRTGAYTGEVLHFDPRFTRVAAGGGLMDIGPIEAMSDRNQAETMMANGGMRFAEGGETKDVRRVEDDPYYTMSGQSGDAFKYLMGQMPAPSRAPAPAPAAVAPVQSTVQAAPAPTSNSPFDGVFGKIVQGLPSSAQSEFNNQVAGNRGLQLLTGGAQPQDQGAGGYWADAPGSIKPYTFDPNTGTFTAAPAPKVWVPYTPAPAYLGGDGGYGGFDGGVGASSSSASGGGGGMSNSGEGGGAPGEGGWASGGIASLAQGGVSHLGDYSDGGRLLKGPGDGVSDSIPASIGDKRPARLADGEFVVPARIVSELGNGSTEAGARKLYAMMDRVQSARKKSIGKDRVAVNSRAEKLLPA
jgi:hypothetical protein